MKRRIVTIHASNLDASVVARLIQAVAEVRPMADVDVRADGIVISDDISWQGQKVHLPR